MLVAYTVFIMMCHPLISFTVGMAAICLACYFEGY